MGFFELWGRVARGRKYVDWVLAVAAGFLLSHYIRTCLRQKALPDPAPIEYEPAPMGSFKEDASSPTPPPAPQPEAADVGFRLALEVIRLPKDGQGEPQVEARATRDVKLKAIWGDAEPAVPTVQVEDAGSMKVAFQTALQQALDTLVERATAAPKPGS